MLRGSLQGHPCCVDDGSDIMAWRSDQFDDIGPVEAPLHGLAASMVKCRSSRPSVSARSASVPSCIASCFINLAVTWTFLVVLTGAGRRFYVRSEEVHAASCWPYLPSCQRGRSGKRSAPPGQQSDGYVGEAAEAGARAAPAAQKLLRGGRCVSRRPHPIDDQRHHNRGNHVPEASILKVHGRIPP